MLSVSDATGWQSTRRRPTPDSGNFATDIVTSRSIFGSAPSAYTTNETFSYDALGNAAQSITSSSYQAGGMGFLWGGLISRANASTRSPHYQAGTGRQVDTDTRDSQGNIIQNDQYFYDEAGNAIFSKQQSGARNGGTRIEDRASFYAADQKLRAADYRNMDSPLQDTDNPTRTVFEEYRYDALGRRVWVRARAWCDLVIDGGLLLVAPCRISTLKRTVWDGDQEVDEIQMPGDDSAVVNTLENDTAPILRGFDPNVQHYDINPYYGRVAYAFGLALDKPLSITRTNYRDRYNEPVVDFPPYSNLVFWDAHGAIDGVLIGGGTLNPAITGQTQYCLSGRCVGFDVYKAYFAYDRGRFIRRTWNGSLAEDKLDKAGTLYRRNRVYDPATGRFTQEDPIGLTGGLNLYGFGGANPGEL